MKSLFDLNRKRNFGGALVFYIISVIIILLLVMGAGYLVGQGKTVEEAQIQGLKVGQTIGVAFPVLLSLLILRAKGLFKNIVAIILAVLSLLVSLFGGSLLGLLPVAFLVSKTPNKKK